MPLDDLLDALRRESLEEREALLAGARAEAQRIEGEAREGRERARREALNRVERDARAVAARQAAQTRHEARRGVLDARLRFLDAVFAETARRLAGATATPAYMGSLQARIGMIRESIGTQPATLRCLPVLAEAVRGLVHDWPEVRVEGADDAAPGLLALTSDGRLVVDATLAGELDRRRGDLAIEVLATLESAG